MDSTDKNTIPGSSAVADTGDSGGVDLGEEILRQFSFLSFVLSTQEETKLSQNDAQNQVLNQSHKQTIPTSQTLGLTLGVVLASVDEEEARNKTNIENPFEQYNDSDDEYGIGKVHEFGNYGSYFRNKHIKQQRADSEYLKWDKERNNGVERIQIFSGLTFHVNGYTVPSINELHRLVIVHGGKFLSYLTKKSAVTHVICDRLTPRKLVEFKHCKVVRAQWIVDCIDQQKLLDWKDYRTIPDVDYAQQRLAFTVNKQQDTIGENHPATDNRNDNDSDNDDMLPLTQSQNDVEEQYGSFYDEEENISDEMHVSGQEAVAEENNPTNEDAIVLESNRPSGPRQVLDAKHPDFLKNFFANSRLHHLSTWKADLRLKFLRRIVQEKKHTLKKDNIALSDTYTKVILHIDFDCFFATASAQNYPHINMETTPVAVSHGGRTSDVASCNYVARSFGVKNGMWVGGAKKLCPNLICLGYDFEKYETYAGHLYNYLLEQDFLDTIFPVLIDEVLVDATLYCNRNGSAAVEDEVNCLMTTIRKDIHELTKCTVSIGASQNVLLAKLSLRKAKPDGQYYLCRNFDDFLMDISVRNLPGVGRSIESRIAEETQVKTPLIQHLRTLTETRLINLLGQVTGKKLWNYAYGIDDTSIDFDENNKELLLGRKTVSLDVNYGIRFDKVDQVDKFLLQLAQELYARLVSLRFCGSQLTLKLAIRAPDAPIDPPKYLGMGRCYFVTKSSRLGVATNDWGIVGSELKSLLRIASIKIPDLRGIAVTMSKLEDVEVMKRSRQKMLDFNDLQTLRKRPKIKLADSAPHAEYSADQIDWEVFKSLPQSLQMELEDQMRRSTKKLENAPEQTYSSPTKSTGGVKTYLQQLIPYQHGVLPEYVRVIEKSPTKKPRQLRNSPLPQKKKRGPSPMPPSSPSWQNETYDSSVLQELPSSVRAEVIRDREYGQKVRRFKHESMRQKILDKRSILRDVSVIDQAWIDSKPTINTSPLFLNSKVTTMSMKKNIAEWIHTTVDEGGPHPEDVAEFAEYIKSLLQMRDLTRCMVYVREMENRISYESAVRHGSEDNNGSSTTSSCQVGIDVWKDTMDEIKSLLLQYCRTHKISIQQ